LKKSSTPPVKKSLPRQLSVGHLASIVQVSSSAQLADEAIVLADRHACCSLESVMAVLACMFPELGRRADVFSDRDRLCVVVTAKRTTP
jgi:hypothetical protein